MYEFIPYILSAMFVLLGGFMALFPAKSVKKEYKDSEEQIKKCRRNGIIIVVAGTIFLLCVIFLMPK